MSPREPSIHDMANRLGTVAGAYFTSLMNAAGVAARHAFHRRGQTLEIYAARIEGLTLAVLRLRDAGQTRKGLHTLARNIDAEARVADGLLRQLEERIAKGSWEPAEVMPVEEVTHGPA